MKHVFSFEIKLLQIQIVNTEHEIELYWQE
jgi:hypothetical protein